MTCANCGKPITADQQLKGRFYVGGDGRKLHIECGERRNRQGERRGK